VFVLMVELRVNGLGLWFSMSIVSSGCDCVRLCMRLSVGSSCSLLLIRMMLIFLLFSVVMSLDMVVRMLMSLMFCVLLMMECIELCMFLFWLISIMVFMSCFFCCL